MWECCKHLKKTDEYRARHKYPATEFDNHLAVFSHENQAKEWQWLRAGYIKAYVGMFWMDFELLEMWHQFSTCPLVYSHKGKNAWTK